METIEKQDLQKRSFRIGGMFCVHCQDTIEKELKNTAGVRDAKVNYRTGKAAVTFDNTIISFDKIHKLVESLGYRIEQGKTVPQRKTVPHVIGVLVIIFALFMLMQALSTSKLAAAFPLAKEGMGYGMLLVIGLLTSVHCIAMCGGINLSQTLQEREISPYSLLLPSILYNSGRLAAYTVVGVLVGAVGSVITLSGHFQGVVQLIAGVFMVIMGINMLGLFPGLRRFIPQMPEIFSKKIDERKTGRGPLLVGFLNGFMPCGPLQAMQIYALSTGSPIRGGISMFIFCLGTIPLMFALGAASSALTSGALRGFALTGGGQTFSRRVMQTGAVLVAALGLVMFSNGWSLSGFTNSSDKDLIMKPDNMQIVNSILQPGKYPAITVQQGIPVRWTINAPAGSINGCNNRMIIKDYGIQYAFKRGDNVIEFTPVKTGKVSYSCWMGMIKSTITVLAKGESAAGAPDTPLKPAGIRIPIEKKGIQ